MDVALYEGVFSLLESLVPDYDAYGMVRQRTGGPARRRAHRLLLCRRRPGGRHRRQLELRVRAADAGHGPRRPGRGRTLLATEARGAREEELDGAISAWTGSCPSRGAGQLDAAGVPAGTVYDAPSIADDKHYLARGMIQTHEVVIEDEPEKVRFPGVVPEDPRPRGPRQWVGPELGEHTDRGPAGARRPWARTKSPRSDCRRKAEMEVGSRMFSCATDCRTKISRRPQQPTSWPSPRPWSPPV